MVDNLIMLYRNLLQDEGGHLKIGEYWVQMLYERIQSSQDNCMWTCDILVNLNIRPFFVLLNLFWIFFFQRNHKNVVLLYRPNEQYLYHHQQFVQWYAERYSVIWIHILSGKSLVSIFYFRITIWVEIITNTLIIIVAFIYFFLYIKIIISYNFFIIYDVKILFWLKCWISIV